ncbi:MAG: aminoglycoside phosphotransferase family protein [Candidatus Chromulinivorax sp.]|nr:aminoglycoside phosphotransferase family protein [Candidatus Chromulinivorax sp.]
MKIMYQLMTTFLFFNLINIANAKEIQESTQEIELTTLSEQAPNYDIAITYLSEKWQLNNLQPFVYEFVFDHYVARAYSHLYQQDVVIKINESNDEAQALQHLQNDGMVKLLDYDDKYFALLLQYIPAQGNLTDFIVAGNDDDLVIDIFIDLFKKIHCSSQQFIKADFATLQDRFAILWSYNFTKIPEHVLQKAMRLYDELFSSDEPYYLLHCDLHCQNILQYQDSFIVIDPWPAMGPLEYEVAPFLVSPTNVLLSHNNVKDILQHRLNRLSDLLHFNKKQLKNWSFMRLILLACTCEMKNKNDDWIYDFIQVAHIIEQLEV